jgi:hypothetical protein
MNGYHSDQFITNMDDYLCGICKEVCNNASVLSPCGHLFCTNCIEEAYRYNKKCPTCREVGTILSSPWHIQKINGSMYRCKYQECSKVDALHRMLHHETSCEYESIICKDCNESILLNNQQQHQLNCPKKPIPCTICGLVISWDTVDIHPDVCKKVIVSCECGSNIERGELPFHKKECPKEKIHCPYKRYGCTMIYRREEMKDHIINPLHITLLKNELDHQVYPGKHHITSHHHTVELMSNLYHHKCDMCHEEIVPSFRFPNCVGYHCSFGCDFDLCISCFNMYWDIPQLYNPYGSRSNNGNNGNNSNVVLGEFEYP